MLTFVDDRLHHCWDHFCAFCFYLTKCHPRAKKFYGRIVKPGDDEDKWLAKEFQTEIWFTESGPGKSNWNLGPTKHWSLCVEIARLSSIDDFEQCTGHTLRALCITQTPTVLALAFLLPMWKPKCNRLLSTAAVDLQTGLLRLHGLVVLYGAGVLIDCIDPGTALVETFDHLKRLSCTYRSSSNGRVICFNSLQNLHVVTRRTSLRVDSSTMDVPVTYFLNACLCSDTP